MPRGGYRPGSGRPRGSSNVPASSSAPVLALRAGDTAQFEGHRTPLQYLTDVMNDRTVDPQRRDRAAQALLPFCHARPSGQPASYNYVPKREEAERKAKWAGYGSPWWELLHSDEERERLEAELQSDPAEHAWVEAEEKRDRAAAHGELPDWRDPKTGR